MKTKFLFQTCIAVLVLAGPWLARTALADGDWIIETVDSAGYVDKFTSISGTITAPDGLPVENAQVVCYVGHDGVGNAWTNTNGQYTVTGLLPNRIYRVAAYPPASSSYAITPVDISVSDDPLAGVDIQLNPDGITVSGTVTDNSTGLPLEDVRVGVHISNPAYEFYGGEAYTEPNGFYQIENLPSVCIVEFFIDNEERYARAEIELCLSEDVTGVDFQLQQGASITGTIAAPDGSPVGNAQVICFIGDEWIKHAWTDANGQYTANSLIPGRDYRIAAYPPIETGYMITAVDTFVSTGQHTVDIQFDPNGLSISGTVTDKSTGLPLGNVRLHSYLEDAAYGFYGGETLTDPNGFYELTGLPPVEIGISAFATTMYARFGTNVDLTADATGIDLAIPLVASLSGIIIDTETAQPIPNIEIEYWNDKYATWTNAVTDTRGRFSLTQLPPEIAEIIAMPDIDTGYAWSLPWLATWINIPEASDVENRVIALQKGALVTGYLKHPDGSPLTWMEFDYHHQLTEGWSDTDQNGYFEIRLPLGNHGLSIETDDGYSHHFQTVNITDLSTPVALGDIIIYSQADGSQITGSVSNPTAAPYQGEFEVSAFKAGTTITPDNCMSFCEPSWVELPDFGPYTLNALPQGNYDIYLWLIYENPQGPETIVIRDIIYNVPTGTSNIDLTYDSQGGTLTGRIINQYGDPVLGAAVILTDSTTESFAGLAETDADGQFTVYNFEPGTYTLTAVHPVYLNIELAVTITPGATTEVPTITMDFAGIKQGSDLNGDGRTNIADIAIFSSKWLTTDSDANFDQQGLVQFSDFAALARLWMSQAIWYNEITE